MTTVLNALGIPTIQQLVDEFITFKKKVEQLEQEQKKLKKHVIALEKKLKNSTPSNKAFVVKKEATLDDLEEDLDDVALED